MDPYIAKVIKLLDQNKAFAALLAPVAVAILGAVASWIATGEFGTNEIRIAVAGIPTGIAAMVATYVTPTKQALVDAVPEPPVRHPTDAIP
jgi:hypothetical protein